MLFSDSRRNAFCVRTGCFLFALTMLLSCATEENSSSSKCSSSDDPTSVCYSPRGDFFLFEDLYNDGVFSKAEVKQIAHWNNTPNTSRNTGNDSETIVSAPTLDPSTERTICYDYYNDYYFKEGKADKDNGYLWEIESVKIDAFCGEFHGYYLLRFLDGRYSVFSGVKYVQVGDYLLEYPNTCGEVLRAWKPRTI